MDLSRSSGYRAGERKVAGGASFSNSCLNRRQNGHHVAQNMTTVGSAACTTDSWNASGFRTCNIVVAFTTFESDKASHVKIRPSARHAAHRHIRDTPDTTRRSRARQAGMGSPIVSENVL